MAPCDLELQLSRAAVNGVFDCTRFETQKKTQWEIL
jgi:hypothetical protein